MVGKCKPESTSISYFGVYSYFPAHGIYYAFAYRKAQSGSLRKVIQLNETFKNFILFFCRNTASCIGYIKIDFLFLQFVTEGDFTFLCELNGIVQ